MALLHQVPQKTQVVLHICGICTVIKEKTNEALLGEKVWKLYLMPDGDGKKNWWELLFDLVTSHCTFSHKKVKCSLS